MNDNCTILRPISVTDPQDVDHIYLIGVENVETCRKNVGVEYEENIHSRA